jgi:nicotinamide-nucleotide amidase
VIYTAEARSALLGLPERSPDWRPSTETYAGLLAETARARLSADWGLGESGAAGPTGNRYGDPAGHSCIALAGPTAVATTLRTSSDDRLANMKAFTVASLRLLLNALPR